MKNVSCPKCGNSTIKEEIYQENISFLGRVLARADSASPRMKRKYICQECGHHWEKIF